MDETRLLSKKSRRALEFAIGPIVLFSVWWLAYKAGVISGDLLPSPVATVQETFGNIATGNMTRDFLRTLVRVLYSILIAISFGVPVGILLGAKA
jgi:ABC-type nitrate/sulfonate/bicarbonate transport system permease component